MQKTIRGSKSGGLLLAVALGTSVAAPAIAQTSLTINGVLDAFTGSLRYAGDPDNRGVVGNGGLTPSYIDFKATEDLGGGLKANFDLISFLQLDTGEYGRYPGDTTWIGNVGLSGSFGTISLGREKAPHFLPTILFNPLGNSYVFSPLSLHSDIPLLNASSWGNAVVSDVAWSNAIRYETPNFGGLSANLHYQFGEVAGNNGVNNVGTSLFYFGGPLSLTAYYHTAEVTNPIHTAGASVGFGASQQKAWMLGGSYDLKAAKLYATYGQTSHNVDLDDKILSLGATVPVGPGKVLAAWAQTKREGVVIGPDQERTTTSLGYDYDLSKRTDLYAIYMNDRITNQSSGNSFGVGIRHRF